MGKGNNNKIKESLTARLLLAVVLCASAVQAKAQYNFDVTSIEAYIQDHKDERSLLLARATLEVSNRALHEFVQDEADEYRQVNIDLNHYTRAFDIIDLLYQSLRTVMNAYGAYNTVSTRIDDFRDILQKYNERILERGHIESADTALLHIAERCINTTADDVRTLYRSLTDLVLYVSGASACSTADLMVLVESINLSFENITAHVNRTYWEAYRFIELRTGYWKRSIYRSHTTREMAESALERWIANTRAFDY